MPDFRIENAGDTPELFLYDDIGPTWAGMIGADQVVSALKEIGDVPEVAVRINSLGGDVFEGVAIHSALARQESRVRVEIDGIAASIASLIAMAGDEVRIAENGFFMIHQAWTIALGNKSELEGVVEVLSKIDGQLVATYAKKTGLARERLEEMLAAETWLTADEALAEGFADAKSERSEVQASVPANRFRNVPRQLAGGHDARCDRNGNCLRIAASIGVAPGGSHGNEATGSEGSESAAGCSCNSEEQSEESGGAEQGSSASVALQEVREKNKETRDRLRLQRS